MVKHTCASGGMAENSARFAHIASHRGGAPSAAMICRVFAIIAVDANVQCRDSRPQEDPVNPRIVIVLLVAAIVSASTTLAISSPASKETPTMHASGEFDIKVTPQKADNPDAEAGGFARMALNKRYHGKIDASGHGEMLASGDGTTAGAYVAIEKVSGSLDGRRGSFVLLHSAVMVGGVPRNWSITVVPDSGTEDLTGLEGSLRITVAGGKHSYDLEYHLPNPG